jgi:hypothetical protein
MTSENTQTDRNHIYLLPIIFFFGRIILFLGLIPNDLYGFGDLPQYFKVASLPGWPFFNYWVEYPPIFPFINSSLYKLVAGGQFVYDFLMISLFSLAGAGCIVLFQRIAEQIYDERSSLIRTLVFFGILAPLPYTWWYYELIPVFLILLSLYWMINGKDTQTGLALALGILTKWFPALLLPALFRFRSWKRALKISLIAVGLPVVLFGFLYLVSPKMTLASLVSQPGRASWQTAWALIDGNYTTGEYILLQERLAPGLSGIQRGNPAAIPSWLALIVFAGFGLWFFWKVRAQNNLSLLSFFGITWIVYLLWSPGWSPQWILYLIPLILLTFPVEKGFFWSVLLTFLTLIEWPTLLKHNLFVGLWFIVPARIIIFLVLIANWFRVIKPGTSSQTELLSTQACEQ